jgi:hypothetical protein
MLRFVFAPIHARRIPSRVIALWLGIVLAATLPFVGCAGGGKPAPPSFTLSAASASPSVVQGYSANSTITVIPLNGFSGSVALSASGLPAGVTASFSPASTSTTSVLTLSATSTAATGTTPVTVTGMSGNLSPTTPLSLTVAVPSVTIVLSPSLVAVAASTQTQTFAANVSGNISNLNVAWSADGVAGGNPTVGTVSATGLYSPPATGGTHTVTATSVALPSSSASANVAVTDLPGVFTYHNDLSRDGANTQEYALSPSTVTTATFGKLFSCPVDGAVYTQPLWVPGLNINGEPHNVIFVATQHDTVFAFDADASPCVTYWHQNLLGAGENPVVWNDVGYCYGDVYPEVGVTGTPVIDPATNTIYLVSASEVGTTGGACSANPGTFYHRLHALDITTGNEQPNSPVTIAAKVAGTGDGSAVVNFSSQFHHNRSGLALSNGTVYVAFAAHEDATPYHGWLLGYGAADVQQQTSVFNTTPNGGLGGIWAGGGAPAVDSAANGGDVYVATGNGIFDESSGMALANDYGDSVLRLNPLAGPTPNGANLSLAGWFTPYNELTLEGNDTDLGSGGPVLLPDQTVGPPHLLVQLGKDGVVYLIDRDNMGQFQMNTNSQILQYFAGTGGGFWGTAAFWENGLYFAGNGDNLKLFSFSGGMFGTTPASQSSQAFNFPDASPSISSQGSSNGIAWAIDASLYGHSSPGTGPAILHAYDATNLATELWNTTMAANNRDQAGNAVKFVPPTIANGKVYLSTRTEIDVYGLLN